MEIEKVYQKKTPLQHVLLRPDTYVGSVEKTTEKMWVLNEGKIKRKEISYVPGLYKIFDEILVNAADNYTRDPSMTEIRVVIDKEKNQISVWNDGKGIPVVIHKEEDVYVPELIFGHLLTSSHYNDEEKKITGGRNGFGAKLTNIFSCLFSVETVDSERGLKFKLTWKNNMRDKGKVLISQVKERDYTKIVFRPDLEKFGMTELDNDIISLFEKRVYDIAGCNSNIKVKLGRKVVKLKNFCVYTKLYFEDKKAVLFEECNERWQVCVALSNKFEQISFVNSIFTAKGGNHVNHVLKPIISALSDVIQTKNNAVPVKSAQIKNYLFIAVNCRIENPAFNSQTKEFLNSMVKNFGSRCDFSDVFIKKITKLGIVEKTLEWAFLRQKQVLQKTRGKKTRLKGLSKLSDATKLGPGSTLILTEGDSAMTFAIAGLSVVGRKNYGAFPLKGKPLNVRDISYEKYVKNTELSALRDIIGLQHETVYTDTKKLRYGRIMLLTDQDNDGSHIKGLLINFIHYYWPELLKIKGFITEFITPLVKATKGKQTRSFYSQTTYEKWRQETSDSNKYKIKYYKGLGTSGPKEAKLYFKDIAKHSISFVYEGESDDNALDLVFNKKKAAERKDWLTMFVPGTILPIKSEITYSDFIHKELVHFSVAHCLRSIPSVVDGFKPGQRKVLYTCFLKKITKEIKIAQLSGMVSQKSAYHHGEESLNKTIIGMAQAFVGSNNVCLLYPSGSFGSRRTGGKDAASPRYIYTRLCNIARVIFPPEDDFVLTYLEDDGMKVEPEYYVPIVPMILINGSDGIGTGWSSNIPNYNPREIVENIKHMLEGEEPREMHPWYRKFKGDISYDEKEKRYDIKGVYKREDKVTITELPVGTWTQSYKQELEKLLEQEIIVDFSDESTDTEVLFTVELPEESKEKEIESLLQLCTHKSCSNMHLFDSNKKICKYFSVTDILKEFFQIRLSFYTKRKHYLVGALQKECLMLANKARFVLMIVQDELIVKNKQKEELFQELETLEFDKKDDKFDYLLDMPIHTLTSEKIGELIEKKDNKIKELELLINTTEKEMWTRELEEFVLALEEFETEINDLLDALV